MPPLKVFKIDANSSAGIILFKKWITKTFPIGFYLYFDFYRIENVTDDKILFEIENRLSKIFNAKNYRKIHDIRDDVFVSLFKLKVDINTPNLYLVFGDILFC